MASSAPSPAAPNDSNNAKQPQYVTEVPSSLKQLARMVVRGFYTIEDALIIDMLVRNPCMKEDDIAELLRFEKKQMRARIQTLKSDKIVQARLKMETGPDNKAAKVNYFFINYKVFVNVVKYKLDIMRKRMETEERDATSRASFKCLNCLKTFTDLEADQLFDINSQEFRCTFCNSVVEEDSAAVPKVDSRLMLARFNEQMQPLYDLLREAEGVKLSPELLEPEPVDINTIRGLTKPNAPRSDQQWSGEATRNQGFVVEETRIDINIGGDDAVNTNADRKDRPVWMTESTVVTDDTNDQHDALIEMSNSGQLSSTTTTNAGVGSTTTTTSTRKRENEDTMSLLLQHERKVAREDNYGNLKGVDDSNSSDSSDDDDGDIDNTVIPNFDFGYIKDDSDDAVEDDVPTVLVAGRPYPLDQVKDDLIAQMTQQEKENYIHVYQQHYSHIYD